MFDPMSFLTSMGLRGGFGAPGPGGWETSVLRGAADPKNLTGAEAFRSAVTGSTDKNPAFGGALSVLGGILGPKKPPTSPTAGPAPAPAMPPIKPIARTSGIADRAIGPGRGPGPSPRRSSAAIFASPFSKG
jgi:hypothetical protein